MSKCASSVISPTLVERHAEPEHARPGHRIVAADQQGQRMARRRSPRPRRGSAPSPARWSARRARHRRGRRSASQVRGRSRRRSGRSASGSARSSSGARSHAPGVTDPAASGAPTSPTGALGVSADEQVGKVGPAAHRFDPSSRARLRRRACGTACSSTATSRRWSRCRAIRSGIIDNGAIGIAGRQDRPRRQAHRTGRLPRQGGRRARRRLGHAGPDRLPHPSRVRRHPRRRACDAPRRRDL